MTPTICSLSAKAIDLIRAVIPVLEAFAVLLFMVSGFQYVRHTAEGRRNADRSIMMWGLVALFVLFSLWAILGYLKTAFFPDDGTGGNTTACGNVRATSVNGTSFNGTTINGAASLTPNAALTQQAQDATGDASRNADLGGGSQVVTYPQ